MRFRFCLLAAYLVMESCGGYPHPQQESKQPSSHQTLPSKVAAPHPPNPVITKSVVEMVQPQLSCPQNYNLFKDKCVTLAKRPVDFRCTKGFEIQESAKGVECVKVMLQQPKLVCNKGFSRVGDSCTRQQDQFPEYRCTAPYVLVNRHCVLTTTVPPERECPMGYRMVDGHCVKLSTVEPRYYCEGDGYELDTEYMRCVGVDWKPLEFVCPAGTIPQRDGKCKSKDIKEVDQACAPDQTQEGDTCVKVDTIEVTSVCDGSKPSDLDENCVVERVLDAQQRCPQDYTLDPVSGKCQKIMEAPLEPVCIEGVLDRSVTPPKCRFQESTLPSLLCPEGYEKEGDLCVRRTTTLSQPSCDDGYVEEGEQCVKETFVDVEPFCNPGYQPRGDTCVRPKFEKARKMCPPGFEFKFGQCSTTESTQPKLLCPPGFALQHDKCVSTLEQAPDPFCACSNCEYVGGKCVTTVIDTVQPTCKEPFHFNEETEMCEHAQATHPDAYCPQGFTYNGDSKSGKKAYCTKTETAAPKTSCEPGYQLDSSAGVCRSVPHVSTVQVDELQWSKNSPVRPAQQPVQKNQDLHSSSGSWRFLEGWF